MGRLPTWQQTQSEYTQPQDTDLSTEPLTENQRSKVTPYDAL